MAKRIKALTLAVIMVLTLIAVPYNAPHCQDTKLKFLS